MAFTAAEVAEKINGEIVGDANIQLTGFAPANSAKAGDLTFAENEAYFAVAETSAASAIVVEQAFVSASKTLIRVKNARVAFAIALPLFFPETPYPAGIHPTAVVATSAEVDSTAYIGPQCVIGERVKIGSRVVLQGLDYVGNDTVIADDARIFPNVTVYHQTQIGKRVRIHSGTVVGSDGYGYVFDHGSHLKIPQIGNVIIHDDVEVGANVTIDRGALGSTVIGRGTKIDNLVQIAHNVVVGENCLLIAQVGIAGSTQLGNYVTLAGQVGIAGHLKIGNRVTVAAKAGVMTDIADNEKYLGAPAGPDRKVKRQFIALQQLPDWIHRVQKLEKRLELIAPGQAISADGHDKMV